MIYKWVPRAQVAWPDVWVQGSRGNTLPLARKQNCWLSTSRQHTGGLLWCGRFLEVLVLLWAAGLSILFGAAFIAVPTAPRLASETNEETVVVHVRVKAVQTEGWRFVAETVEAEAAVI